MRSATPLWTHTTGGYGKKTEDGIRMTAHMQMMTMMTTRRITNGRTHSLEKDDEPDVCCNGRDDYYRHNMSGKDVGMLYTM